MKKTPKIPPLPKDIHLWQNYVKDVKQLDPNKPPLPSIPIPPSSPSQMVPQQFTPTPRPSKQKQKPNLQPLSTIELNSFQHLNSHYKNQLKKDHLNIDAKLDLHGLTTAKAQDVFTHFISNAYHQQKRRLLIITGKGRKDSPSIIRASLETWVNSPTLKPFILGLFESPPRYGGSGAFIMVLKRKK